LFDARQRRLAEQISQFVGASVTFRPSWYFDRRHAAQRLQEHLGVSTLEGFGIGQDDRDLVCAAGAILEYLNETQKTALPHIRAIKRYNPTDIVQIDPVSLRSLEVLQTIRTGSARGSLLESLDSTLTGMGRRLLRRWLCQPSADIDTVVARHDAVGVLKEADRQLQEIRQLLAKISDIERIAARICTGRAGPRDLLALGQTLALIPQLQQALEGLGSRLLGRLCEGCDGMEELAKILVAAIDPDCPNHLRSGGVIKDGFDQELDRLRGICQDGQGWLDRYLQEQIQATGIQSLKIGFNQVFGYYIEVPRSYAGMIPEGYHRKQTVKNAERYQTEPLRQYQDRQLTAQQEALDLEIRIFDGLRQQAAGYLPRLQGLAEVIAQLDCLQSFAYVAQRRGYVRPQMTDKPELMIKDGRHPVLEQILGSRFVPNDVNLGGNEGDLWIITGPNMSGKSTFIRQVALLVLMAQAGSFIPAAEATIGIVDKIFTRVGASDELGRGQSTFMVEMIETANILNNATGRSLVILDEVGRGTSTYDGLALAWAIAEHIATKIRCRTLFATHYHELTELAALFENIRNYNVVVREWADQVIFLHRIEPGGTDKSYGIHVARLAGIPEAVVQRARQILAHLQATFQNQTQGIGRPQDAQQPAGTLFDQVQRDVIEQLKAADVERLTPIEAINLLYQIKQRLAPQD
jgi:DNA mismatch repair protein MutS